MTLHRPSDNGNTAPEGDQVAATPEAVHRDAYDAPMAAVATPEMIASAKQSWFGPALMDGNLTKADVDKMSDEELQTAFAVSSYLTMQKGNEITACANTCNQVSTLKDQDLRREAPPSMNA